MATGSISRTYTFWEELMLAEWCAARQRDARVMTRVRLGPIAPFTPDPTLTDEERRMIGASWRRWADAIVVRSDVVYVVEAAMVASPGDISLVQTYMLLFDHTPELEELRHLPRRGLLVWAVDDPYARQVAVANGLEVDVFKPSNFGAWLNMRRAYERRPARTILPNADAPA